MLKSDLQNTLDNAPVLEAITDSKHTEQIEELLKHPGLPLIWGLLLGAKQGCYRLLENSPLGSMSEVSRAAVIQGTIKGIDQFYHTLIELTVPPEQPEQEQK